MEFLKKNKWTIVIVGIFLIFVFLVAMVINSFTPEDTNAIYGERLQGIKKISTTTKNKIQKSIEKDDATKKCEVRTSGRILDVVITLNPEVDANRAKDIANKVVENLSKNDLKYYDVQVFLTKNETSTEFPIIGYRHHSKDNYSWTKERK